MQVSAFFLSAGRFHKIGICQMINYEKRCKVRRSADGGVQSILCKVAAKTCLPQKKRNINGQDDPQYVHENGQHIGDRKA